MPRSEVAGAMKPGALVILRSTMMLGTTRKVVLPILDKRGFAYDIAFCPERTLEGVALKELRWLPQIVGGGDLRACVRAVAAVPVHHADHAARARPRNRGDDQARRQRAA